MEEFEIPRVYLDAVKRKEKGNIEEIRTARKCAAKIIVKPAVARFAVESIGTSTTDLASLVHVLQLCSLAAVPDEPFTGKDIARLSGDLLPKKYREEVLPAVLDFSGLTVKNEQGNRQFNNLESLIKLSCMAGKVVHAAKVGVSAGTVAVVSVLDAISGSNRGINPGGKWKIDMEHPEDTPAIAKAKAKLIEEKRLAEIERKRSKVTQKSADTGNLFGDLTDTGTSEGSEKLKWAGAGILLLVLSGFAFYNGADGRDPVNIPPMPESTTKSG